MAQNEIRGVAGQHYAYIKKALNDFKTRNRTNDAGSMKSVASSLSDQDIDNLAQYIASREGRLALNQRVASNRNHARRSASSIQTSRRLAVATS